MNKNILRKLYLEKRMTLTQEEYNRRNLRLCAHFFEYVNLSDVNALHVFLPIKEKREPDTWLLIRRLTTAYPQISIVISKTIWHSISLELYRFEGMEQLKVNKWGIPEPEYGQKVDFKDIDLVLVPLVSFDMKGSRIGYGKGFYDRFMAQCRPDVQKIGYALSSPLDYIPFNDQHDVHLNGCITPYGMIHFNNNI
ncbi:MAG: 5-formyltetrahydrofolate cyclo-ligase [Cyclobacteriaceae bacterium]|nr:5-formyltetrahydrofolate cyclo-ligase [Cyclobacteriaceae bacterium]